jgi:hypothetical protein
MSRPLRSTPVTEASPLLRAGPPANAATVLNASRFLPFDALPLTPGPRTAKGTVSASAFPRSMQKPQTGLAPPLRRTPPDQYNGSPARLIPGPFNRPGFDVIYLFRRVINGSLALAFPIPT